MTGAANDCGGGFCVVVPLLVVKIRKYVPAVKVPGILSNAEPYVEAVAPLATGAANRSGVTCENSAHFNAVRFGSKASDVLRTVSVIRGVAGAAVPKTNVIGVLAPVAMPST